MDKQPPLTLPSLRGNFGNWIYYTCLMSATELATRVHYAREIHDSKELSDMIQRSLEGDRARHIAEYIRTNGERFFNSLVLATYDGSPEWFDVGNLQSSKNAEVLGEMQEGAIDTLGLLRLDGSEKIFALDGQHRLAGIRRAIEEGQDLATDLVPLVLVGHALDAEGSRRTRRLFTTLNKTAIAVKKKDIIALDEDDVMAITARRMVEKDAGFKHPRIAVVSSESMPTGNQESLITISALYDLLKILFVYAEAGRSDYPLRFNRPSDAVLDGYHKAALDYFNALGATFPPIAEFMRSRRPHEVVERNRTSEGGHVLFRSLGLEIFTRAAIAVAQRDGIAVDRAISQLSKLPVMLDQEPFRGTIWDPARKAVRASNKTLARRVVFHMLKLPMSDRQRHTLEGDYRAALGHERDDAAVKLPKPVV